MEPHEKVQASKKQIIVNNFLGGISWAIGTTVGFAIIFIILGYALTRIDLVPIIGGFIQDILQNVLQSNPQLLK